MGPDSPGRSIWTGILTGQPGQFNLNRTFRVRMVRRQDRKNRTAGTGHPGHDSRDRIAETGLQEKTVFIVWP